MSTENRTATLTSALDSEVCYIPPAPGDEEATASERAEVAWRAENPDREDAFPLVCRKGWVRICGVWMKKTERLHAQDGGW
jgi:hypothetical protein